MLSVVLHLGRQVSLFSTFLDLGVHDWHLDLDQRVRVALVNLEAVLHLELLASRVLEDDPALAEWDQVRLEFYIT